MIELKTISDSKKVFHVCFPFVIAPIYRRITDELLVELHLLNHQKEFKPTHVFSLGLIKVFEEFMQGYRPEEHKSKLFDALCKSNNIDSNEIRKKADLASQEFAQWELEDIEGYFNKQENDWNDRQMRLGEYFDKPGTPKQNAEEAIEVIKMGYKAIKFDPFGQKNFYRLNKEEFFLSEKRISEVRKAVGENIEILIEGHAKFNVMNAVKISEMLKKYNPLFFEEPVSEENASELIALKKQTNLSLATGERLYTKFPFVKLVEDNTVDVLQPDIANAGGLTELKKISIIAEGKHITIAPHNTCSPVGAIAEMHLGKNIPNFEIMEYHAEFYSPHYFKVFEGFPRQKGGYVTLTDKPGLGLDLNEKEILKHPPYKSTDAKGGAKKTI